MVHDVDERWTMAYAAGLGHHEPVWFDTTSTNGVVAHPLFPVCPEWPVIVAARALHQPAMSDDELGRGVHATHDLTVHRLVRPGDQLTTSLEVVGVEQRGPGTYETMRITTVDQHGEPVSTTIQGSMYLGVGLEGESVMAPVAAPPLDGLGLDGGEELDVPVAPGAAHTYTECARIWNPIHTDKAVALAAGLPDIILHGTATMALAVSAVMNARADGDPARIRRICGRFRAMVLMPSTIRVRVGEGSADGRVRYEVINAEGDRAIDQGVIVVD
ncbi:MAG: hypothetical protein GY745_19550 [Actinomycetia bacterium]|nr:hypothetical protein [Actinomycetes bacterium]MCP3910454.1 hypothetical protein [Actinomycetes bacterium]MCP4087216.1 hypothetical protein [Actinomycetes bacterium]